MTVHFTLQASEERFCFLVEWYDPQAALIRRYNFMFYPRDNTIEMVNLVLHINIPYNLEHIKNKPLKCSWLPTVGCYALCLKK